MRTVGLHRISWLAALLVACGDDGTNTGDGTTAATEATSGPSTSGPSTSGPSTSGASTSGSTTGSTTEGSTTQESTSDASTDSTSGDATETTTGDDASTTSTGSSSDSSSGNAGAPDGVDDVYYGVQEELLVVDAPTGALANDDDAEGDPFTVIAFDATSSLGGDVEVAADGSFTFDPAYHAWGPDTFTYTVSDGVAESIAQVTVHVAPTRVRLELVTEGMGGYVLEGEEDYAITGCDVAGVGDLDGDGFDDVIIGAYSADTGSGFLSEGRAYVVFGHGETDPVVLADVADGDGGGFVMNGDDPGGQFGRSVARAGNVDGDGVPDIIVGAPDANAAYVVFGRDGTAPTSIGDVIDGTGGFAIQGDLAMAYTGMAVASAGDMNGDGRDDVLVGAPFADVNGLASGRAYVVFAPDDTATIDLADVAAGSGGFAIDGPSQEDYAGINVSKAGDVDGDGRADVIIGGGTEFGFETPGGRAWVVFGKDDTNAVALADVESGVGGFLLDPEPNAGESAIAVRDAGDIDGDGLADVLVGDPSAQNQAGRAYVVFGKQDTDPVALGDLGDGGFAFDGSYGLLHIGVGTAMSVAGDVNGDGFTDLLVGQGWADTGEGHYSGRTFVVYGSDAWADVDLVEVANGIGGFAIEGLAGEGAGKTVDAAGDVNGDGLADIVIGAESADVLGPYSGRGYVVFGVPTGP